MKYILESLSIPVRLDHDRNILSYECLNVVVKVSGDLPLSQDAGQDKELAFINRAIQGSSGLCGCLATIFSFPTPCFKSRVCKGICAC